jgi:hypothetical protein
MSRGRQYDASIGSVKQDRAQLLLQGFNSGGDIGLHGIELCGGPIH